LPRLTHPGVAFLDRDGTINAKPSEGDYVTRPDELELLPGAAAAIRSLNDAGVTVVVVTNQRGIALGRMTERELAAVHERLATMLASAAGAHVDSFLHCPHDVGQYECRKPAPGLLRRARERFPWVDLRGSAIVGDSESDVQAGRALGMQTVQLGVDTPDLRAAVDLLLGPAT
jgi:D-glycero-D-manno-heptose 1,7-bisphosphate phosphatase